MFGIGRFFKYRIKTRILRFRYRNTLVFDTVYRFSELNTRLAERRLASFRHVGIDEAAANGIVVSLTSFPERIPELKYTLYSLLTQSLKPRKVVLWLAREQFPSAERDIDASVLRLRDNGLEIRWTRDIRSYKKLVPSLRDYPDQAVVTADDDIFYPRDWLKRLYDEYRLSPLSRCVYGHRVHRIAVGGQGRIGPYKTWARNGPPGPSFLNLATSGAGALFPPGALHPDVLDEGLFMSLAPTADDLFFWAMAVRNGNRIRKVAEPMAKLIAVNARREGGEIGGATLFSENVDNRGNDRQLAAILARYPEITGKLVAENHGD